MSKTEDFKIQNGVLEKYVGTDTEVVIPEGVTSIGDGTFDYCKNLASISVDKSNSVYDSRDNCNAIIETKTNNRREYL